MANQVRLSIIIPAYNASRTISRALDSVLQQINDQVEVLVIENGSEDDTFDKVQVIVASHSNCRLFRSAKGVSVARNVGIQYAKGEWVTFLDADDYLVDGALSAMLSNIADYPADLYVYAIRSGIETYDNSNVVSMVYSQAEILKELIENPTRYMQVCANVYRMTSIQCSQITFNHQLTFAEDSDFTMQYLKVCNKVLLSTQVAIFCPNDEKSTTRTFDGNKSIQYLKSLQYTEHHAVNLGKVAQSAYVVYTWMNFNVLMVRDVFTEDNLQSFKDKVKEMRRILSYEFFAKKLKAFRINQCTKSSLLPILFIKLNLPYIAALGYVIRAKRNAYHEQQSRRKFEKEINDV